jgi:2-C-methyl-D-erythritol 4-phosphate cytidylyltransferase
LKNLALVLAAGCGKRFKGSLPKQYVKLGGREILAHAIQRVESEPLIEAIVVVAGRKYIKFVREAIVKKYGFKKVRAVIAGGNERYDSVYNALKFIVKYSPENVVIHDGARPVFDAKALKTVLASLKNEFAVVPATRINATVKQINNGYVVQTIDRDILRAAVTPQGFKYADLLSLYSASVIKKLKPTDEAFVFENVGIRVKVVEHEGFNLKVTNKEDINILNVYFETQNSKFKTQKSKVGIKR